MNLQSLLNKKYSHAMLDALDKSEWSEAEKEAVECIKALDLPLDYEQVIKQFGIEVFKTLALIEIDRLVDKVKTEGVKSLSDQLTY